ncbi:MAG: hypothetical protein HN337_06660 [Deltaproteobacteria bacterium]|jgi:CysZ protein|nr:hypothetical protein [Deltaproteobacteria bacterium]
MSRTQDFIGGFLHIFKGFKFLTSHRRLWVWAIIPTLINLLIVVAMISIFTHYYGDFYGWLASHMGNLDIANPTAWYMHILDGILWVLNILFQILIILISLILMLVIAYGLSFIVAAPFNDALSERVETALTNNEPPPFSMKKFVGDMLRIIKIESIKAAILLAIPILLFILNIIPVIGGPIYVFLTLIFGAWDLGFAFADLPMGRKVIPLKERWGFAKKNKWALIGFGTGFIIPFFTLVFAAPMVVGGTLLYVEKSK